MDNQTNCTETANGTDYKILTELDPFLTTVMFAIICFEILGAISNTICIYIVSRIRKSNLISRPKMLMANIALADTLLMMVTIIPRFLILNYLVDPYPMAAHVIQSFRSYLENVSLHVEAITMALLACDRFFALKKVFNNPFDALSTCTIISIVWAISMVFSIPFVVTTDIDYWDYSNLSVVCKNMAFHTVDCGGDTTTTTNSTTTSTSSTSYSTTTTTNSTSTSTVSTTTIDTGGDIQFFDDIMGNESIVKSTRLFSMLVEFVLPTLVVIFFSAKIVIRLFDLYSTSGQRVRSSASVHGCEITKRLIFILFIFVMKNSAFILVTGRWSQVFSTGENFNACPTSVSSGTTWFFLYEIYRITTTVNSFIYFWMSSDFRDQCRMFLFKYISSSSTKRSVKEQTLNFVQVLD